MHRYWVQRVISTSLRLRSFVFFSSIVAIVATEQQAFAQDNGAPADAPSSDPSGASTPAATDSAAPAPTDASPATPAATTSTPPAADQATSEPTEAPPPPKKAPYSLPFNLRPTAAATVLRLDSPFAFYKDPGSGKSGSTIAPVLTFSYKVVDHFAPVLRLGVVENSPPSPGKSGTDFLNPVVGGTYVFDLTPEFHLGLFLGFAVPVGTGGGDHPDAGQKLALAAGIRARSAMDNAMFAVNDFVVFPGVDLAYVSHGFTAQAEATLLQLTRVRGAGDPTTDSSRTNFTAGLHVGYFFVPAFSFGAELRHQRWLSTPKAVAADKTGAARDTTTIAFGPRFHIKVGKDKWLRPAVAFVLPLDDPMSKASYKIIQVDVPFAF
ncbi:MAG TPA: hypothetical protein VH142_09440 [Polyangiaceae bacterium]|jgi:hypothetical protein|nr:hypothetical protein [Polyangiaceae bacterium]